MPRTTTGPNYKGALFSFLRVLAVALASAILPFVTAPQSDEVPTRAVVTAVLAAFLLTVINFFRPGEPRFGTEPKTKVVGDAGRAVLGTIGVVLALIGAALLCYYALAVETLSKTGLVLLLTGGVLLVLDRDGGRRLGR